MKFISGQIQGGEPPPPPREPIIYSERFKFGVSTGSPVILFVIGSDKSIRDIQNKISKAIWIFLNQFWRNLENWSLVYMGVAREDESGAIKWFTPYENGTPKNRWHEKSLVFFDTTFDWFWKTFRPGTLPLSESPLERFGTFARQLVAENRVDDSLYRGDLSLPWVHYIYFKDQDLVQEISEDSYESRRTTFLSHLDQPPFSKFRYQIISHSYLKERTQCLPLPSRISHRLQSFFRSVKASHRELCPFFPRMTQGSSDQTKDADESFYQIAQSILESQKKIILRNRPILDTLKIRVGGLDIPRHEIFFHDEENEIVFTQTALSKIRQGDEIEIHYQREGL